MTKCILKEPLLCVQRIDSNQEIVISMCSLACNHQGWLVWVVSSIGSCASLLNINANSKVNVSKPNQHLRAVHAIPGMMLIHLPEYCSHVVSYRQTDILMTVNQYSSHTCPQDFRCGKYVKTFQHEINKAPKLQEVLLWIGHQCLQDYTSNSSPYFDPLVPLSALPLSCTHSSSLLPWPSHLHLDDSLLEAPEPSVSL